MNPLSLSVAVILLLITTFGAQGCGTGVRIATALPALSPAAGTMEVGTLIRLSPTGLDASTSCTWSSSAPSVLSSLGGGRFKATQPGQATASAICGDAAPLAAQLAVTSTPEPPIVISQGGTYSGNWTSNDPTVPAVTINTDEPVTIRDAVLTGRGDLIDINGTGAGANVTIHDVSGTALDPGTQGLQRGSFLSAQTVASLHVDHCSMYGVSYGIQVLSSTVSHLVLSNNLASNLEDRASDGNGGLLPSRPSLGHFIFLNQVAAPLGAEISWNQLVNTIGQSSTEDVINLFKSQGSATSSLYVHDNYMEGYSSTTTPSYTGTGIITDGDSNVPVTAYVLLEANQMVHSAGSGIEIAVGHDITVKNNRVVSCGLDAQGNWFAMPFVNAIVVWNYYGAPALYNDIVEGTEGGMLRPAPDNTPQVADLWSRSSDLNTTDKVNKNDFTDPCLVNGQVDLSAEDEERSRWTQKVADAGTTIGDRHMP